LGALLFHAFARYQMYIALVAYAAYLLNATQFLIKLRAARLDQSASVSHLHSVVPEAVA
jgi:3-vinyl bacteriochlorophyllide hydratase